MASFSNFKSTLISASTTAAGIELGGTGGVEGYADVNALPENPSLGALALVTGTNKLYVYNGSAWFNIAIVNQAPTAISGNLANYVLAADGTPTVVTLVSTDPEGLPLTWSATTSGDSQVGTLTQADNVFTITPSTDQADIGTLSLTFSVTDGNNTETSVSSFILSFLSPLWRETLLSIGTSSTDGLNNSTFIDRSTNARTITPVGTPIQTAFNPYLDNWSYHFPDGSNKYLSLGPNEDFNFGQDDFTVECYYYHESKATNDVDRRYLIQTEDTAWNGYKWVLYTTFDSNVPTFFTYADYAANSSTPMLTGVTVFEVDKWYHIALVRSGNEFSMYINGKLDARSTRYNGFVGDATTPVILGGGTGQTNRTLAGRIFDFRIVKGTAVYTGGTSVGDLVFTPSIEKLENISGTVLLTARSNRFIDESSSSHSVGGAGSVIVTPFTPLAQESEYDVGDNKGSLYSPSVGAGRVSFTTGSSLVTGDFTIEGWFYLDSTGAASSYGTVINNGGTHASALALSYGDQGLYHRIYIGTLQRPSTSFTNGWMISTNKYALENRWTHIAIVRDTGKIYLYLNGVKQYFAEWISRSYVHEYITNNSALDANFLVGGWHGSTSDVKFTDSAVYTANFTPPTSPVSPTNADTYLPMDNPGIFDKTSKHSLTLIGDVSTSTTQTKYADTAIYFDGTGDVIRTDLNEIYNVGTNDFTVEFWVNPSSWTSSDWDTIFATGQGGNFGGLLIGKSDTEQFVIRQYGTATRVSTGTLPSVNTWTHVACVRSSGTSTIYYNGTSIASASDTSNYNTTTPYAHIGNSDSTTYAHYFNGYVENLQFLPIAKYTTNFTSPNRTQGRTYQAES